MKMLIYFDRINIQLGLELLTERWNALFRVRCRTSWKW